MIVETNVVMMMHSLSGPVGRTPGRGHLSSCLLIRWCSVLLLSSARMLAPGGRVCGLCRCVPRRIHLTFSVTSMGVIPQRFLSTYTICIGILYIFRFSKNSKFCPSVSSIVTLNWLTRTEHCGWKLTIAEYTTALLEDTINVFPLRLHQRLCRTFCIHFS